MAKHPVPKKKTSKARTKRRYASFKAKVLKRLRDEVAGSKHKFKRATEVIEVAKETSKAKVNKIKA